jgi:pimeloyl-ACP methyl ester carboxylesterase
MAEHTYGNSRYFMFEDGRKLHYWQKGEGGPAVVFESAMAFSGSIWGQVQPEVAKFATTIVYDRAGTGRSDDLPGLHTLSVAVADLSALLRHLSALQPFVLVGSSWGGPIIRTLAAGGEHAVHGLVLVDQSDEHAPEYFTPAERKRFATSHKSLVPMARLGLYKLMGQGFGKRQPADVYKDHLEYDFSVRAAHNFGAEITGFIADMEWLLANPSRLEGVEVSVISGTRASWMDRKQRVFVQKAHRITAEKLANARLVQAEKSGHYVMFDQPELVVSEIRRVLGK